jgi:ubiquinol-cytochrome c reductase iron-sulfur subunit
LPNRAHADEPQTRRSFLTAATAGAGIVVLGAAGWGLMSSLAPSADIIAKSKGFEVKLSDIPVGTEFMVKYFGKPVFIRHRTAQEIEQAEAARPKDLWDNSSLDLLGRNVGSADDKVRRATPDGQFIALIGTTRFCVGLAYAGDWNGWFDPCHGGHYDTSGRIRKGPGINMALPVYELVDADTIRFVDPKTVLRPSLDELLYR